MAPVPHMEGFWGMVGVEVRLERDAGAGQGPWATLWRS